MAIDIFTMVFEEFLKISPSLLTKYSLIQDQLLYLILIPHVILFLFLFGFGQMIINEHKGLRYLVTITAYVFIIWGGWYGGVLVPLSVAWFYIMLIFGFFLFFISKFFHPLQAQKLGSAVGPKIGKAIGQHMGKNKEMERLQEELKFTRRKIQDMENLINNAQTASERATYNLIKDNYEKQAHDIVNKIRKLS